MTSNGALLVVTLLIALLGCEPGAYTDLATTPDAVSSPGPVAFDPLVRRAVPVRLTSVESPGTADLRAAPSPAGSLSSRIAWLVGNAQWRHGDAYDAEVAEPTPDAATEPAPEVVEPAPDIAEPAPDIVEPAPDIAEHAPDIAEPAPDVAESAPEASAEPDPEIVVPTPDVVEPAPEAAEPDPDIVAPTPDTTEPDLVADAAAADDGDEPNPTIDWVPIPGGTFQMGSADWEDDEQPVHAVSVPAFLMAATETTVAQYAACVDADACTIPVPKTPGVPYFCTYGVAGYENRPVNCLDWDQAAAFCAWAGGRLPSEAEWEYAARGGTTGDRYGALEDIAVTGGYPLLQGPQDVATKLPNAFGLVDVIGNLMEFVADCWHKTYAGAPVDGSPWVTACLGSAPIYVVRDRGWTVTATNALRVSTRTSVPQGATSDLYGFRCAADAAGL